MESYGSYDSESEDEEKKCDSGQLNRNGVVIAANSHAEVPVVAVESVPSRSVSAQPRIS